MFTEKLDHEKVKAIHQPREKTREKLSNPKAKGLSTTLNEFVPSAERPWDRKAAAHVIRRLSFGLNYTDFDIALATTPAAFIDSLIDAAINADMPEPPSWENKYPPGWGATDQEIQQYFSENFELYIEYQNEWTELMKEYPFREKMVLLWHNHFVTEIGKYELAPYAYRHFKTLRMYALGNFKEFVRKIGLDQAMLIYLDGVENRAGSPNENYARELLELFTMGIGNYTQTDIEEIARALTGYWVNYFNFEVNYTPSLHDSGSKTFFERTGNFDYEDVIDIIFEEKEQEIAEFVCTKIYKFFVYETPNEAIVSELAQFFIDENFEIEPVVRKLLKSEHFFDEELVGAMIKSPVELMLGFQMEIGEDLPENLLEWQPWQLRDLGQFLFNPINVAGWPGHRAWISTTTLPFRWQYSVIHAYSAGIDPIPMANAMTDPNDPYQLVEDIAEFMLAVELPQADKDALPGVLLGGIPDYEWNVNASGAGWRILNLMAHIRQLPAYQLK